MASFNRVIMVGNLTRDPEYKQLTSGQAVCRLSVASNRQFKNKQTGSMIQEVCYVDVDVWGAQAESCRQYLQKGRAVLIEGRLKFDTWEDPQGQTRNKHTIVADRVVFMPSQGGAEFAAAARTADEAIAPKSGADVQLEQELLDQIEQIKKRAQVQKEADEQEAAPKKVEKVSKHKETKQESDSGDESDDESSEIEFKDEPPFEDQLPF